MVGHTYKAYKPLITLLLHYLTHNLKEESQYNVREPTRCMIYYRGVQSFQSASHTGKHEAHCGPI